MSSDSEKCTAILRPDNAVKQARLDAISSLQSTSDASIVEYDRYEKMRKILPEAAVRQKMDQDGISADDIDTFFQSK
jgi:hypothetical protein